MYNTSDSQCTIHIMYKYGEILCNKIHYTSRIQGSCDILYYPTLTSQSKHIKMFMQKVQEDNHLYSYHGL